MKEINISSNKCRLFSLQDEMKIAFCFGNFERVEELRKEILKIVGGK